MVRLSKVYLKKSMNIATQEFNSNIHTGINLSGHDNPILENMGFTTHKIHLESFNRIEDAIARELNGVIKEDNKEVFVVLPALKIAIPYIIAHIYGFTGKLPTVVALKRNSKGEYVPKRYIPLYDVATNARGNR